MIFPKWHLGLNREQWHSLFFTEFISNNKSRALLSEILVSLNSNFEMTLPIQRMRKWEMQTNKEQVAIGRWPLPHKRGRWLSSAHGRQRWWWWWRWWWLGFGTYWWWWWWFSCERFPPALSSQPTGKSPSRTKNRSRPQSNPHGFGYFTDISSISASCPLQLPFIRWRHSMPSSDACHERKFCWDWFPNNP